MAINVLLGQLHGELAAYPAEDTIGLRWLCQQVLAALGDERAAPMLEQLVVDVQTHAAKSTDADDRNRLIQAIATFRAIVAAHAQRGEQSAAP